MGQFRSQRILLRTAVLLLLFAVGWLSTFAKQCKYLPKSNPLRNYSKAAKMELLHHPVDFIAVLAQPAARTLPPQPEFSATLLVKPELAFRLTVLTISFQHRAPPSLLA